MHKIVLCTALLINMVNVSEKDIVEVKEIIYDSYENNRINLDIELYSSNEDIVEMKVYFCNENKEIIYNKYFEAALVIKGSKKTKAKIPFEVKENIFLNIIFYSSKKNKEIDNIMFPIYHYEKRSCYLTESIACISDVPINIIYKEKNISEEKEKISIKKDNFIYNSFNNKIPLEKIKINSNFNIKEGEVNLYIKNEINEFDLYYKDNYLFPLEIYYDKGFMTFMFSNIYYLDLIKSRVYEDYHDNTVAMKNIILPYADNEYEMTIELKDCFSFFEKVVINFKVITKGNLLGDCVSSKYCLRRVY